MLSGYILAKVHADLATAPGDAMRFWGRRLARIYPVHLAVLLMLSAIALIGTWCGVIPHDPGRFSLSALGQDLLLIQAWGFAHQLAWNYPSWSISTEWAGYLLFPASCYGIARCPKPLAMAMLIACLPVLALVSRHFAHGLNLTFADSLWRFFPEFFAGILTARVFAAPAKRPYMLLAGLGLAIVIAGLLTKTDPLAVAGLWALIAAFAGQANSARPPMLPNLRLLRFLGVLSYAFYMSFASIELLLAQLGDHAGWNPAAHKSAYALAMTTLTFMLALTLHHLIEKPARRRIDQWLSQPKASTSFSEEKEAKRLF